MCGSIFSGIPFRGCRSHGVPQRSLPRSGGLSMLCSAIRARCRRIAARGANIQSNFSNMFTACSLKRPVVQLRAPGSVMCVNLSLKRTADFPALGRPPLPSAGIFYSSTPVFGAGSFLRETPGFGLVVQLLNLLRRQMTGCFPLGLRSHDFQVVTRLWHLAFCCDFR